MHAHWPSIDSFHRVTYRRHRQRKVTPLCLAPPPPPPAAAFRDASGGGSLYLVVATRNRQDVACDGPADVPNDVVELVQQLGRPRVPRRVVTRPDEDASVLQRLTISHTAPRFPQLPAKVCSWFHCKESSLVRCLRDTSSPESSWRWCWWEARWKEPSQRPSPSHCEPPASDPPSTDRLPL